MSRLIADVIVIGAGIIGCSTAFHLARQKNVRVIVVEKGALASGMTKRSGALIRAHYPHPVEARLALASVNFFRAWKEIVGGTCGWTPTGLVITAGENDAAELRAQVAQLQTLGADTRLLTPTDLSELEPAARVDDLALAAYEPAAGFVDPALATQTLAARAKDLGVAFRTGTLVKNIRVQHNRVAGVETNAGPIDALAVVITAGPWSDRLLKPLHAPLGLRAQRAELAFFDRPAALKAGHCAFEDWTTGARFRPHTFGLTMGGLNAPDHESETNPDAFDEGIAPGFIAAVQARLAARLPALAHARYVRGHAGVYDQSADGHAILGHVPQIPGLYVAAGFSGAGLALAPAVGACLSELATEGEASTVDVRALGMDRLAMIAVPSAK